MSREAKRVLNETYERELSKLSKMDAKDPDYQDTIDRVAKLNKMMNDERQAQTECLTKIVTCLCGVAIGVGGLYIQKNLAYDVLRFEKDDSISSFVGRSVIGNWLKFKVR